MPYVVYKFVLNGVIRYFGRTKNPKSRLSQHISSCYNIKNKAYSKEFYKYVRSIYPNKESGSEALKQAFIIIYTYKKLVDSKRMEMYLILDNYFNKGFTLYQKIPNIRDGY